MANKTFVAKNGLTANTANVFMSQLSGTLTPTAAGKILITDTNGQVGTRTAVSYTHLTLPTKA